MDVHKYVCRYIGNFCPFYGTLSPTRAAAQKPANGTYLADLLNSWKLEVPTEPVWNQKDKKFMQEPSRYLTETLKCIRYIGTLMEDPKNPTKWLKKYCMDLIWAKTFECIRLLGTLVGT